MILYIFVIGKMFFDESKGNNGVLEEYRKLNFFWYKIKKNVLEECRVFILWCFKYDFLEWLDIYDVFGCLWFKMGIMVENFENVGIEGLKLIMEKVEIIER